MFVFSILRIISLQKKFSHENIQCIQKNIRYGAKYFKE